MRGNHAEWGSIAFQPAAHKIPVIGLANWNPSLVMQRIEETRVVRVKKGVRRGFSFSLGGKLTQWAYISRVKSSVWREKTTTKWMKPKQKLIVYVLRKNMAAHKWLFRFSRKSWGGGVDEGDNKRERGLRLYRDNKWTDRLAPRWCSESTDAPQRIIGGNISSSVLGLTEAGETPSLYREAPRTHTRLMLCAGY